MIRYWLRQVLSFAALALLILGWTASPASAVTWSTTDLHTGTPLPSGIVTVNNVQVRWQVGNYLSDGLRIYGLLCTPISLKPPYPVAILNHGLEIVPTGPGQAVYPAIEAYGFTGCTTMAGHGWLTAISTYRGESIGVTYVRGPIGPLSRFVATSDGKVELCLGEVDDVLNLLDAVRAMPDANSKQVLMWGHSHGSCITERAIERGAPIEIAVSIDGPTDFITWNHSPSHLPVFALPRSPAFAGNDPAKLANVRLLRIHAEGDVVVTPDQGCELASKIPTMANYYLTGDVTPPGVFAGNPPECSAYSIPWIHGQLLPDEVANGHWAPTTFLMYSGLSHIAILIKSWPEFRSFVNMYAKSDNWHADIPAQVTPMEN
jgi:hypothetical protein